nr:SDR family NAD(P)-dependent oxidoreductase [Haematospirillum sp. 15-248]
MGKTIVITGATAGIGLAAAKRFVQAGWKAVLIGRRAERLEEAQHQLGGHDLCVLISAMLWPWKRHWQLCLLIFLTLQLC